MAKFKLTQTANKERARLVFKGLQKLYPDAHCALYYETPVQLLVATILSAQCTDVRVNIVTKTLFKRYRTPRDYVGAPRKELEAAIRTCGFYRQKAKNIVKSCSRIIDQHGGAVPDTMDALLTLDGVGRKTANVLLGECFNTAGIIVDTHCKRVTRRLGFTRSTDPAKVERDLMKIWPREDWTMFSHYIVFHGRNVCAARAPQCSQCMLHGLCPFPETREGKRVAR